jgi:hypothetical protein
VIRFAYQHNYDPKELHRQFLRAGARPHLYSYRPCSDTWTLTIADLEEAVVIQGVLEGFGVAFRKQCGVTSRFVPLDAGCR